MDLQPEDATAGLPKAMVCEAPLGSHAGRVTTATILLLAAWVGLIAGFLDMSARLPVAMWAALLLSGGLATQLARLVSSRSPAFLQDDCILYLDRRLGILLQELEGRGVLDDTLVIVTADHGDHLGDHLLFFHGCSLYRQLVQVPLVIVDLKGVPADRVVALPVSLRDVPATVVDLLGLGRDAPFPGRSLAGSWGRDRDAAQPLVEPLLMETGKPLLLTNQGREPVAKGPMKSLVAEGMHYNRG